MEHTNEIALRSKNAEELARRNKEFLEKYDTDDKQIDYYTDLAMKLYDEFQIDGTYTFDGVRKSVATWYANKSKQMQLLRKHHYWDEEAKAIVFLQTETRNVDYSAAANELTHLSSYVAHKCAEKYGCDPDYAQYLCDYVRYALANMSESEQTGLLTEDFIKSFNESLNDETKIPDDISKMLRVGTKITRLVRKCFEHVQLCRSKEIVNTTKFADEGDARTRKSFEKYYARFADSLSELKIERITVVSLNFLDFMTMSNGNSWSSCHFINSRGIFHEDADSSYRGEYKQGCLSYALDEPSMIMYTLPNTFKQTDYYRCQKLTRMCCQYSEGILITGKCYPNNHSSLITRYRQMMQLILSQVGEFPNVWTFSRKTNKIGGFVETAENSAHYPDYIYDNQKPTISICKSVHIDLDTTIKIGHEAYCLDCGSTLCNYDHKWLQCAKHRKTRVCECCGKFMLRTELLHEYVGNYYCDNCVFFCEHHNRYEPIRYKLGTIRTKYGEKTVCRDVKYELVQCKDCGVYFLPSEMTDGICNKCIEKYDVCAHCGHLIKNGVVHIHDGAKYCAECFYLMKSGIDITPKEAYEEGDYVLIKNNIDRCVCGTNQSMRDNYPNRIVRITSSFSWYEVSELDGWNWSWSADCFRGVVNNCKEEYVGKTLDEVINLIKEAANEN